MAEKDLPPYLRDLVGSQPALNPIRFDLEDVSWSGKGGDQDLSGLVAAHGFEPEPLLRLVVRAIIAGQAGDPALSAREREDRAMAALEGRAILGRPEKLDRHYLMIGIVRAYAAERLNRLAAGDQPVDPDLEPIIRVFIPDDHPIIKSESVTAEAVRRWIRREFIERFDLWMKRVHDFDDPLRLQRRAALRQVLAGLNAMGVAVDLSVADELPAIGMTKG